MNSLENWANFPGCQSICASRGKSSENLPVEKKYLEKISLIEKVATFVDEFISKNGRTWSEINKIDFKINKRTFSSISKDDLTKLKENAAFQKISAVGQKMINNLLVLKNNEAFAEAFFSKTSGTDSKLDPELINSTPLDKLEAIVKNPKFKTLSTTDQQIIKKGILCLKDFEASLSKIRGTDSKLDPGLINSSPLEELEAIVKNPRFKTLSNTDQQIINKGILDLKNSLAKNSDRQQEYLLGLTKEAREDFANEIFRHATAPLKTPSTVNTVDFSINIDDLLSFQERDCDKYTGEEQFDNDLERLNKSIDNEKLEGKQAKETLRKSLAEILPGHQQDLFDRTLNIFSQNISNIIPLACYFSFIEDPEIVGDPEGKHHLSVNLISNEQRIEFKSSHPIVNTKETDLKKTGQLDVVISIPLDPTKVANFTLTRSWIT